jgi:hypothetical protein
MKDNSNKEEKTLPENPRLWLGEITKYRYPDGSSVTRDWNRRWLGKRPDGFLLCTEKTIEEVAAYLASMGHGPASMPGYAEALVKCSNYESWGNTDGSLRFKISEIIRSGHNAGLHGDFSNNTIAQETNEIMKLLKDKQ